LVISENPSGAHAYKGSFPERNRIIAGLAKAVIIVEAPYKSGAINTARQALAMGVTVAAVPGPIDSPQSAGSNLLIRDGALMIASVADALTLAGVEGVKQLEPLTLNPTEKLVWSAIGGGTVSIDAIGTASKLAARDCMTAVTSLELRGLVECLVSGEVRRR
jgi:DNA processing protein